MLHAGNAELGLELAHSERPDVIFMDIHLPGMNGFQALRELKANPATQDISVIAVTAGAMPQDLKCGRDAGFFDYIVKPIDLKQIQDVLQRSLGQRSNEAIGKSAQSVT